MSLEKFRGGVTYTLIKWWLFKDKFLYVSCSELLSLTVLTFYWHSRRQEVWGRGKDSTTSRNTICVSLTLSESLLLLPVTVPLNSLSTSLVTYPVYMEFRLLWLFLWPFYPTSNTLFQSFIHDKSPSLIVKIPCQEVNVTKSPSPIFHFSLLLAKKPLLTLSSFLPFPNLIPRHFVSSWCLNLLSWEEGMMILFICIFSLLKRLWTLNGLTGFFFFHGNLILNTFYRSVVFYFFPFIF